MMNISEGSTVLDINGNEYKVDHFLGHGSFGFVYKIISSNNEPFALKAVLSGYEEDTNLKSFLNEGELATKILHQNVIKYYYVHDGKKYTNLPPYIIMEFANQGNLDSLIKKQIKVGKFFTDEELVVKFQQLINGMKEINNVLVHRDIKPDNILLHDGILKISDFGLAKIAIQQTRTNTFKGIGHLAYMAPEGWKSESNTIQMDIYSMGLVFYQLATLTHPYEISQIGDIVSNWKSAHLFSFAKSPKLTNPNLSNNLVIMIQKMLEKSTADRFKDWSKVQDYLDKHMVPEGKHMPSINIIVDKINQSENMELEAKLNAQKDADERKEFLNLISYQFEKDIKQPLKEWGEEFNIKSPKIKVVFSNSGDYEFNLRVTIADRFRIQISIEALYKFKWRNERKQQFSNRVITQIEEVEPKLDGAKIMAWGHIKKL